MIGQVENMIRSYVRNGRWGTCAACPRLSDGLDAPELCEYTERYDHQLGATSLVEQIVRKL